mgnify:CR=1 FL=1
MITTASVKAAIAKGLREKFRLHELSDDDWDKVFRAVTVLQCIERGYKYERLCCEIFGLLLGRGEPYPVKELVEILKEKHPEGSIRVAIYELRKRGLIEGGNKGGYIWFTQGVARFIGVPYINPFAFKERMKAEGKAVRYSKKGDTKEKRGE